MTTSLNPVTIPARRLCPFCDKPMAAIERRHNCAERRLSIALTSVRRSAMPTPSNKSVLFACSSVIAIAFNRPQRRVEQEQAA